MRRENTLKVKKIGTFVSKVVTENTISEGNGATSQMCHSATIIGLVAVCAARSRVFRSKAWGFAILECNTSEGHDGISPNEYGAARTNGMVDDIPITIFDLPSPCCTVCNTFANQVLCRGPTIAKSELPDHQTSSIRIQDSPWGWRSNNEKTRHTLSIKDGIVAIESDSGLEEDW